MTIVLDKLWLSLREKLKVLKESEMVRFIFEIVIVLCLYPIGRVTSGLSWVKRELLRILRNE